MRSMHRAAVIALASLSTLVFTTGAAAQSSEGATVFDVDECQSIGSETVCLKGQVVLNFTQTPSGLLSNTFHSRIHQTRTGGGCSIQEIDDHTQGHNLVDLNDGTLQESSFVAKLSSLVSCGGTTLSCDSFVMIHQANGAFQFDRTRFICTEP